MWIKHFKFDLKAITFCQLKCLFPFSKWFWFLVRAKLNTKSEDANQSWLSFCKCKIPFEMQISQTVLKLLELFFFQSKMTNNFKYFLIKNVIIRSISWGSFQLISMKKNLSYIFSLCIMKYERAGLIFIRQSNK